jgi:hypothetical protein
MILTTPIFSNCTRRKCGLGAVFALCCTRARETYHHWKVFTPAGEGVSSDDALEFHLEGTDPGSQSYEMAARELARREAARSETLQLRWIKRTFWATIILGVAAIVATVIAAFV